MKEVKFIVKIGYKEFKFETIEEATFFAVTAKKTALEIDDVSIEIEWAETEEVK